ncbi:ABC transporter permease [Roseisalinus antarcticus]|uniref:Dipeptide transport system permease protein DppB n=1 Tax=Roseisalinus antarcticus TaxID=254357 RepID=A0A1Y5T0Q1_9RHOB|nr:ABC transporter permease [Roseisalinus antarcticus]SLN53491.1 Dipeptide transport system permease protein DppB [Roseisalinus antarcticus]
MRIAAFIAKRLALLIPVLIGVSIASFFLIRLIPGDPVLLIVPETATEADIAAARERLGLDQPVPVQYLRYLGGVLQGDFGTSIATNRPVAMDLAQRLPVTLELVTLAMLLAVAASVALGVHAARRLNRLGDMVTRIGAIIGNSLPEFWLGIMLILLFYQGLGIAPAPSGRIDSALAVPTVTGLITVDTLLAGRWDSFLNALAHLALPVVTLAVATSAPLIRSVRASAIEVMQSDNYRCAAAHGLPEGRLVNRYLMRQTLTRLPALAALVFGNLIGGSVLIEFVFSWQGLGQWALRGMQVRDYPVIQSFVLVTATAYVLVFLVADIVQAMLDPRVRI